MKYISFVENIRNIIQIHNKTKHIEYVTIINK